MTAGRTAAENSARVILPLVFDVVHPQSVVDFGCGTGAWLQVASELGVDRVYGVDSFSFMRGQLAPAVGYNFRHHNLGYPLRLEDSYDLALCLEVAEHLDRDAADTLLDTLTSAAPAVLFSAAIPHQPGRHHVNCQWPDWWAERFHKRGYHTLDVIRPKVWNNEGVKFYYAQNTILYSKQAGDDGLPLRLVHPETYLNAARPKRLRRLLHR